MGKICGLMLNLVKIFADLNYNFNGCSLPVNFDKNINFLSFLKDLKFQKRTGGE